MNPDQFNNISDRRQSEEKLGEQHQLLRSLIDSLPDLVYVKDTGSRFLLANQALAQVMDTTPEGLIGKTDFDFYPQELAASYYADEQRVIETGQSLVGKEEPAVSPTGLTRWFLTTKLPFRDSQGAIKGIIGIGREITQRRAAEEQVRKLSRAVQQSPSSIVITDTTGRIEYVNPRFTQVTGYTFEEAVGQNPRILKSGETPSEEYRHLWSLITAGQEWRGEFHNRRKNGQLYWEFASISPITDEAGRVTHFLAIKDDITERKLQDQQLRESLERRGRQVYLSTQVAQDIATATNLADLYRRVVVQVKEQFGYYHAQFLRYDPAREAVTLVAGSGQAGLDMLAQKYQVPLGAGPIGLAAAVGVSVLRSNVTADPAWQPHPVLPDTKGELAVPITLGSEDPAAQVAALRHFRKIGLAGWAVYALDPAAVAEVARETLRQGTPVVAVANDLGADSQSSLVSAIDYDIGYMLGQQAGRWAAHHLAPGRPLQLAVLNYRSIPAIVRREEGIIAGLKAIFSGPVDLVADELAGNFSQGLAAAEKWLKLYPDLRMILGINDAAALGAYQAVITAGRDQPDRCFVGGIDATAEAVAAIKSGGAFQATISQPAAAFGVQAIRTLVKAVKGLAYEPVNPIICTPVNRASVDEFLSREAGQPDLPGDLDCRGLRLGLSVMNLTNSFFVTLVDAARKEAARLGIDLLVNDPKRVLGVLDVQSDLAGRLDADDQLALEGLCGQVAVAIESTRLRQEMENSLSELNAMQRLLSQEGWLAFQTARTEGGAAGDRAYFFDQAETRPVSLASLPLRPEAHDGTAPGQQDEARPVIAPVAIHGEVIGGLGVVEEPGSPLAAEDRLLLESISLQVAQAMERVRLLEQAQRRAVELEAVAQVGTAAASLASADRLLQTVVDLTKTRFGLYHAHIYLLNETGDTLVLAAGAGEPGRQMVAQGWQIPLSQEHSLVARTARTRQGVIANDVRQIPDFLANPLLPDTQAEMTTPLLAGDQLLGVLDVQASSTDYFTRETLRIQSTLAAQVAVALQNARLYQQTQATLAQTELLYTASRAIAAARDEAEIIAVLVHYIDRANLDRIEVAIAAEQAGGYLQIEIKEVWDRAGQEDRFRGNRFDRHQVPLILSLGQEVVLIDNFAAAAEVDDATRQTFRALGVQSAAILPISTGQSPMGWLLLETVCAPHQFTLEEVRPFVTLAGQAALVLNNARLLDQARTRARYEQLLREITARVRASTDPEVVMRAAVRELGTALGRPTFVRLGSAEQLQGGRENR